jgi:hypothetical protein
MNNIIYNGQYECEGHTVTFTVCDEDQTVLIREIFISGVTVADNERKELLSKAIEFQNSLIKFGYDKVS